MSMIQKQIEELRRYADEYDPNANDLSGRAVEGTEKVLRNAAETIELLSAKLTASNLNDGWIPTEKANPEKDGGYICAIDGEICGEDKPFVGMEWYENGEWDEEEDGYNPVLAWMKLPKPYEPKEE